MSQYRDRQNLVFNDPLNRAQRESEAVLDSRRSALDHPPPTYRPLAGLRQNQRGQNILVDSTMFGQISPRTGQSSAARTTVVQARSPGDDAETLTVTLAFAYQTPIGLSALAEATIIFDQRILCELTWGVGGAEYTAIVDWMQGTALTLTANYLRVVAIVPDNSGVADPTIVPAFRLTASIAYGYTPQRPNRAKLTQRVGALVDAAQAVVAIPPFAIGYTLAVSSPPTLGPYIPAPFLIEQFDFDVVSANVLAVHQYNTGSNNGDQAPSTFPILNGARFLRMTNISGQDAVVSVLWDMVL